MRNTFLPMDASKLNYQEKNKALESLIFLKEKKDGTIKGCACDDGRKQRVDAKKGDATSLTVSIEAVLITAVIDAKEERDVAVIDIQNSFVQTEMDNEVLMIMHGRLAELMAAVAPEMYNTYITIENIIKVLYVKLLMALYGTLKAALRVYQKLYRDLE